MHYINQCLEPGRIMNHIDDIIKKKNCDKSRRIVAPKEADMIELQLTDRCNLNCFHCHFRNQGDLQLKREWISLILNEIKPKAISLAGGGEPTLYPDFDKVIKELKSGSSNPDIGLISNGVYIPEGNWPAQMKWIRISLYSIIEEKYAGKKASIQERVLDNISKYMEMASLNMLGVSLLYYKGNVVDCIKLSFELYKRLVKSGRKAQNFNIQFKRAFVINDPRVTSHQTYQQSLEILPDMLEIQEAIKLKKELSIVSENFGKFIDECTNYKQLEEMEAKGTDAILVKTMKNRIIPDNYPHCYVALISRLITPDGYVYTCPTIAEHREIQLALGHITDSEELFNDRLIHFFECREPWCNSYFCRNNFHNKIVENYFANRKLPQYDINIKNDNFF